MHTIIFTQQHLLSHFTNTVTVSVYLGIGFGFGFIHVLCFVHKLKLLLMVHYFERVCSIELGKLENLLTSDALVLQ